ncbi:aldo/keto reductase [Microbacterium sp.]|uniref:aldo/keto reductase n=1 Tax=Microbacterium sp. TaxID=51671 RepID=UPI0039E6AC71
MTERVRLGASDLRVFPLNLGGNTFGWTSDTRESHDVLDAYVAAGGNFVDTADVYSAWVEGHVGGESETELGSWLAARGDRDDLVIATKVAQHPEYKGLAESTVRAALEASLRRLQTDYIDLYYVHFDFPEVPIEEIASTFSALVDEGKIRHPAISNMKADRIRAWMELAAAEGLHAPVALQPLYNLMERGFEDEYGALAEEFGLSVLPYNAMARGFLTGKYREGTAIESARAETGYKYLAMERGKRVLRALDEVAGAHGVAPGSVALAWLASRPTVAAPISSARTVEQLPMILASVDLRLTGEELSALDAASAVP